MIGHLAAKKKKKSRLGLIAAHLNLFSSHTFKSNDCRHLKPGDNYLCFHTDFCGFNASICLQVKLPSSKMDLLCSCTKPHIQFILCTLFLSTLGLSVW